MQYWGITDPGCSRPQNQDTYQIEKLDKNTVLFVICDGMGGAKSGNVASSLAADVFVQAVKSSWTSDMDLEASDQMLDSAVKRQDRYFKQAQAVARDLGLTISSR